MTPCGTEQPAVSFEGRSLARLRVTGTGLVLSLLLAASLWGVLPAAVQAAELEKVTEPDLSMLQGVWEGTWERTGAKKGRAALVLSIEGESVTDMHTAIANIDRTITIDGSEITLDDGPGRNAGLLQLYRRADGTKVLKGTYLRWNPTGDTGNGDVYLEQVTGTAPAKR
jgi:hypothetical protein